MSLLSSKLREGAFPQEKPRVYFCAHERDHTRFFESLSDEILGLQNCGIWFLTDSVSQIIEERLYEQLAEMQLFVIPVTSAFLYTDNSARLRDMAFAKERHIPILPIMMEPGLSTEFNRICGNYQYLDKTAKDGTAIQYKDKLATFLASVLVGDEEAAGVRKAFAGYIFLSYRKKDRVHAQKVMRMIHENEQYQDIAIWYDEFLVPGEDFNTSIQQALNKSCLFVLAVTPNLVNEPNYVQRCEYPEARKSGKPIVPVELVATDRALLEQQYPDIPPCIGCDNTRSFNGALLKTLRSLSLSRRDTPKQRYYMGLAYLAGIDVERDPRRGVQLIRRAAQAGEIDAIRKMVSIYEIGDGVESDWKEAIYWQEELVKKRKWVYETYPTEVNSAFYLSDLMNLSRSSMMWGLVDKAQQYLPELITVAKTAKRRYATQNARRDLILTQLEFNNFLLMQGRVEEANELMQYIGADVAELMALDDSELALVDYLTQLYFYETRARVFHALGDYEDADEFFRRAFDKAKEYYEKISWPMFAVQIGEISLYYGIMLDEQGHTLKAVETFKQGVHMLEMARADVSEEVCDSQLVLLYLHLITMDEVDGTETRNDILRAKELAESCFKREPTPNSHQMLVKVYMMMWLYTLDIKREESEWYYEQALQHAIAMTEVCQSLEACESLARLYIMRIKILYEGEDPERAKAELCKVIRMLEVFPEERLMMLGVDCLVQAHCLYSEFLIAENRGNEALTQMLKAREIAENLPAEIPEQRRNRARYFHQLAKVYLVCNNTRAALHYASKVTSCYALNSSLQTDEDESIFGNLQRLYAEIMEQTGEYEKAAMYYERYVEYCERKCDNEHSVRNHENLALGYCGWAFALYSLDQFKQAIPLFEKAIALFEEIYEEYPEEYLAESIRSIQEYLEDCESLL